MKKIDVKQVKYDYGKFYVKDIEDDGGQVSNYYTKPSGGIPKNDLSSTVQTSLNKADTAVQQQTLNNYELKLSITSGDNIELEGNTLNAEVDKYYVFEELTSDVIVMFPSETSTSKIEGFIIYVPIPTSSIGSISFNGNGNDIYENGLSDIEEDKIYEINCLWNGVVWAVTAIELIQYSQV